MTSGGNGGQQQNTRSPAAVMQPGQHSMGPNGPTSQQNPGNPTQQQPQDQMMTSAAPSGQPVPMGQPMAAGGYQPTILSSPIGAPGAAAQYAQYVVVNQHGQHVLQPANIAFPGMTAMPAQTQQPGQQFIIMPQQAKPATQQPQIMTSGGPPASQSVTKSMSQAPAQYTLTTAGMTNSGIVSQPGAPQSQTFMIAQHPMGGSPTLQAAAPNMSTGMPSHIKAEPGKQMANAQQQQQTQQVGQQPMQILPQGQLAYVNTAQAAPGQAFIQNGQMYIRTQGPQDGQAASQLMFSPQGIPLQTHPQTMQPGIPPQQLPPGLTTSMQPMTPMVSTGGTNVVRAPLGGYPTQAPAGKTQISRSQPTILPATNTSTVPANRLSTTQPSFLTQASPKSKQKMSPRTTGSTTLSTKGPSMAATSKSILNSIKQQHSNQMGSSGSPPLLTSNASPLSMIPPGSPSASGPPVLQTSLTAPPVQSSNSNSQPPLLQPMMQMPTSGSNTTSSYVNGGRPAVTMATSLSVTSASAYKPIDTKAPIRPNLTNNKTIPAAAPMEPISKVSNENLSQNSMKPAQDSYIQHVIDGHVIHESSQPFPIDEDAKGEFMFTFKITWPRSNCNPHLKTLDWN